MQEKAELQLLQLFDIAKDGKTYFNRDVLSLLCDQIGDRPIAVISTAGKFRLGKTFWNNVLLNGLQNGKAHFGDKDLIGGNGRIHFQNGFVAHTKGIMVWPEVFDRVDKNGSKLAVILMDTQGTFDTSSNLVDSAIVFAISLLMSSVKIFNTQGRVDAQDLDALNTFIAFSQKSDEKAGQHFTIMVRDAPLKGHINEYLTQLKDNARNSPELLNLLNGVFDAFEKVDCFMIPRPSEEVIGASSEIMAGDCGGAFLSTLCDCANYLLDNLTAKTVMGTPLTGKTLAAYVENLVGYIKTSSQSAICSAFTATSQLHFEKAKSAGNELFASQHEMLVRKKQHRPIKPTEYEEELQRMLAEAIKIYSSNPSFGGNQEKLKQFNDFKKALEDRCQDKATNNRDRYRDVQMADAVNGAYGVYEKEMKQDAIQSLSKSQKVGFVKENHARAWPKTIAYFEQAVIDFVNESEHDIVEHKRKLLMNMVEARFEDLQHDNAVHEMHNQVDVLFNQLLDEHSNLLKKFVEQTTADDIDEVIEKCKEILNEKYSAKKTEFVVEMSAALPKVSSDMINQMLDNYRDTLSAHFKKCENTFESDVRHQLKVQALNHQMEQLTQRQLDEKKRFKEMQEETSAQISDLSQKLDEEKKRAYSEAKGSEMTLMLEMMKMMNENSQREMDRIHQEKIAQNERETRRRSEEDQRQHEDRQLAKEQRAERQEREQRQDSQRREELAQANRDRQQMLLDQQQRMDQQNKLQMQMLEQRRQQEAAAAAAANQGPDPLGMLLGVAVKALL